MTNPITESLKRTKLPQDQLAQRWVDYINSLPIESQAGVSFWAICYLPSKASKTLVTLLQSSESATINP
jgi:hypothetical protein